MSLFDKFLVLKGSADPYQTEAQFETNLAEQVSMARQALAQMRVYESREFRLEFFFYTNNSNSVEALNSKLAELGYDSQSGESAGDPTLYIATGWTTPIRMDEDTIIKWVENMCRLGFENNARFDGNRGTQELRNRE